MPVDQVRTAPTARGPVAPTRPRATFPPSQRTPAREGAAVCLVLPDLKDGEGAALVHNLRRRDSSHAVLVARSAGRREIVTLLNGGIRGAITAEAGPDLGTVSRSAQRSGPELTARELGVLELVADGRSNKQIGEALELSALTVKSHLARISRKVGTGDRAEMVAYAIRNELLA